MTEPARIAKLIRMLASPSDAEALTAARLLKKLTDLNELSNKIEFGPGGISERDKQLIRNAAYKEGFEAGLTKGHRNARPHRPMPVDDYPHSDKHPAEIVNYCLGVSSEAELEGARISQ
jgi:hypothetical protein